MSAVRRVLILDTDDPFAGGLAEVLGEAGFEVFRARERRTAEQILAEKKVLVLLLGMNQSQEDAFAELSWAKASFPCLEVVILSGRGHFRAAFDAMSLGAYDFLVKSEDMAEYIPVIDKALARAAAHFRKKAAAGPGVIRTNLRPTDMIGGSPDMLKAQTLIARIAPTDSPVLISGETGVGKELAARMIHRLSRRSRGPFVAINCGAIPEALLENEFFGHAQGAFTDSGQTKPGLLEEADNGTLFLDEIGELPATLQAKLLRVLEDGTFRRLGDNKGRHVDVRIVAAGNRDLAGEMKAGRMRADFYYRLAVLLIDIPPLRRRREDIPPLVEHFFKLQNAAHTARGKKLLASAVRMLMEYDWPGNVREVRNMVERLAVLSDDKVITPADVVRIMDLSGGQEPPPWSGTAPWTAPPADAMPCSASRLA